MSIETVFHSEWLDVRLKDGWYFYCHDVKSKGRTVAVLVYRSDGKILGRWETCPAHTVMPELCSITGMIENNHTPLETAVIELWEETGYKVNAKELIFLGTIKESKKQDTTIFLYAYDATNAIRNESPPGDGSPGEANAFCHWISREEAIQSKDPLFSVLVCRLEMNLECK